MVKKHVITFRPAEAAIQAPVTKFGGQPFWIGQPQWPQSRATRLPMRFICQIALTSDLFGATAAQMAYLFISDKGEPWDAEVGDNAVVLQPGKPKAPTASLLEGPTLCRAFEDTRAWDVPGEWAVDLGAGDEPEFVPFAERRSWTEEQHEAYDAQVPLDGHKLGGIPHFLQGEQFPKGGPWQLLLQLSSCGVPFEINFGDLGVGYAFINQQGSSAKFLWQCC